MVILFMLRKKTPVIRKTETSHVPYTGASVEDDLNKTKRADTFGSEIPYRLGRDPR